MGHYILRVGQRRGGVGKVLEYKNTRYKRADARMVIRIFCKKIDHNDRDRFDSFSAH